MKKMPLKQENLYLNKLAGRDGAAKKIGLLVLFHGAHGEYRMDALRASTVNYQIIDRLAA